ncbi:hypothetical protein [Wolbachia endosymbiont of Zygogramma bicolorata]
MTHSFFWIPVSGHWDDKEIGTGMTRKEHWNDIIGATRMTKKGALE